MTLNLDQARRLTLPDELPAKKDFVPGIRRAPDRGFHLSAAQTKTALKNALRYIPSPLHQEIAPEFLDELLSRGRIYGYRYRPEGSLKAKAGRRISRQDPRSQGLPGDDRQQPRLRRGPLSLRAGDLRRERPGLPELDAIQPGQALPAGNDRPPDPGGLFGPSARPVRVRAPTRRGSSPPTACWWACTTTRPASPRPRPWAFPTTGR